MVFIRKAAKTVFLSFLISFNYAFSPVGAADDPMDSISLLNNAIELESYLSSPARNSLLEILDHAESGILWHEYEVSPDESLTTIFINEGLMLADLNLLMKIPQSAGWISQSGEIDILRYQLSNDNRVIKLEITTVSGEVLSFSKVIQAGGDTFTVTVDDKKRPLETVRIGGVIKQSFYASAKVAGLSPSAMSEFANIFQWQLDFSRDIHRGDRFEILLEKVSGDQLADDTRILAAQIYQQRRTLTAIRYSDGRYYTLEGKLLGRTFLRLPLKEEYPVSSGFDLLRQHPIIGQIREHKGTDWSVPVGSPVITTADGIVVESVVGHPTAGNYIEIQHGRRYITRYLHLSQLKVKAGQQVRRGEVIGLSGNSGLSTGPHLHYEVYVDGRPVDAMRAKLRTHRVLDGSELSGFMQVSSRYLNMLRNKEALVDAAINAPSEAS